MKFTALVFLASAVVFSACNKKEDKIPTVSTFPITKITSESASCGGIITGENIKAKGVCWSTSAVPTINSNKTLDGEGAEHFESLITGLTPLTTYYVRAYAINGAGTAYGPQTSFKTNNVPTQPTLTTAPIQKITKNSAVSGVIVSIGEVPIVKYGICWSTTEHPTIEQSKRELPYSPTTQSIALDGLAAGTFYYVRAFAQTASATLYGNELGLKTLGEGVTDIDGNTYNSVKIGNQEWMAENLRVKHYRNGDPVAYLADTPTWSLTTSGAYCINDLTSVFPLYGPLYNFHAVNDPRLLAPMGWHIASQAEWTTLMNFLGGPSAAPSKLRSAEPYAWQGTSQVLITNESAFTALPAGSRSNDGFYTLYGSAAYFWTTTNVTTQSYTGIAFYLDNYNLYGDNFQKSYGCSVRCIKD